MAGKHATPDQIAQVVALREAGYTSACIKQRTGLSVATITRIISQHRAKKGTVNQALVEQARQEFAAVVATNNDIRRLIASLVADNLAHADICRAKMLEAIEHLTPSDTKSAALTLRACTAYATALKASTDALRPMLYGAESDADERLPELVVREMTSEDIERVRADQVREAQEMGLTESSHPATDDIVELDLSKA